jgi:deoxyribodipyrimidine photolyase-related protein
LNGAEMATIGRKLILPEVQIKMTKRILYIPLITKQLRNFEGLRSQTDHVVIVESARMTLGRPWHKERLFLDSSARHLQKN